MALKDDVTTRLASFGYTVIEADTWMLDFIMVKIESQLIRSCGVYDPVTMKMIVPVGLHGIEVDMVAGDLLFAKKSTGQLTGFNMDAAVKSIQEGDTNVSFAVGSGSMTPEERIDALITYLTHPEADLASYRKIQW